MKKKNQWKNKKNLNQNETWSLDRMYKYAATANV